MNSLPSDPGEQVIDIFVLSGSPEGASRLRAPLEEGGYRVTLFTDSTELLESLRSGIPNLLICDATTDDERGYDLCRQIKADDNLWMIPVLILTRTASLTDLLRVLDCNADNFIAYSSDPAFLHAQIEGMLSTPVERQTPEMVKTQFRIQHDEKVYLVTADRRKLLELLLSSFEIAVGFSQELAQIRDQSGQLSADLSDLRNALAEQNRKIGRMNETLQQKEQSETRIARSLAEREAELAEKTAEIDRLMKSMDDDRALIASAEEHIRLMLAEKEEITGSHRAITDSHQQKIASLSAELAATTVALDEAKTGLAEKTARLAEAEKGLDGLTLEKEEADRALLALSREADRLRAVLAGEKERADTGERELTALREAKERSEGELAGKIEELTAQAGRDAAEIASLNAKAGEEAARADSAEREREAARAGLAAAEENYRADADRWKEHQAGLQAELASVTEAREKEGHLREAAEARYADAIREKDELLRQAGEQSAALSGVRTALASSEEKARGLGEDLVASRSEQKRYEESYRKVTAELELAQSALDEEKALREESEEKRSAAERELAGLEQAAKELEQELGNARATVEAAESRVEALETELNAAHEARSESAEEARAKGEALARAQAALATEQEQRRSDAENLRGTARSIESAGLELRNAIAERDHLRDVLAAAEEQLDASRKEKEFLAAGIQEIVSKRDQAERENSEKISALEEDLARAREEVHGLEAKLAGVREEKELEENRLSALSREIQQARTALADEWEDHMNADERLVAAMENNTQLRQAEEKLTALASELDQARAALADEWESHMTARERLAAADEKNEKLRQTITDGGPVVRGPAPVRSVIVKDPSLPVTITPEPTAMARVDIPSLRPVQEPGAGGMGGPEDTEGIGPIEGAVPEEPPAMTAADVPIEDLFEETGPDQPAASPPQPGDDLPSETGAGEPEGEEGTGSTGEEGEVGTSGGGEAGAEVSPEEAPAGGAPSPASPASGIAFDRQQWFDLFSWARHADGLNGDQRREIMRMGRLVQRGRKLTRKQEERVREMLSLVQSLGYRLP